MGFDVILCADWSSAARGRQLAAADMASRRVSLLAPPAGGWTVENARSAASAFAGGRHLARSVLLGFDVPLGLPRSLWLALPRGDARHFAEWLWSGPIPDGFFAPVTRAADWRPERPFFRVQPGRGGRTAFEDRIRSQGLEPWRRFDPVLGAKPSLIVSGIPGAVGSSAQDLWRGLREPRTEPAAGQRAPQPRRPRVWPFDGSIARLARRPGVTLCEIYARLAPRVATDAPLSGAKGSELVRRQALTRLRAASWVREHGVELGGFAAATRSDDAFDALLTAAALLRRTLERRPLTELEWADPLAEGGILLAPAYAPTSLGAFSAAC